MNTCHNGVNSISTHQHEVNNMNSMTPWGKQHECLSIWVKQHEDMMICGKCH